jgi:hypothetical protein
MSDIDLSKVSLYRMVHIENIPHILKYGITHRLSKNANKNYVDIGDRKIINSRNDIELIDNYKIGDFIPFYFAFRTPMLLRIQTGYDIKKIEPTNIVYCVSSIQKIIDNKNFFIFSDGHILNKITKIYKQEDTKRLQDIIDWEIIKADYWADTEEATDRKRRKEAEFLVNGDIPFSCIRGFVVYDEQAKNKLLDFGVKEEMIAIRERYYYDNL